MSGAPADARTRRTVGKLIQTLRQAAGLRRSALEEQTGLPTGVLVRVEAGRALPPWVLRRLVQVPALRTLPQRAHQAGCTLDLADHTIATAIDAYCRWATLLRLVRGRLRRYFAAVLAEPIGELTPERAAGLAQHQSPQPQAQAAQDRELAFAFLQWCTRQGWLAQNPLANTLSAPPARRPNGHGAGR